MVNCVTFIKRNLHTKNGRNTIKCVQLRNRCVCVCAESGWGEVAKIRNRCQRDSPAYITRHHFYLPMVYLRVTCLSWVSTKCGTDLNTHILVALDENARYRQLQWTNSASVFPIARCAAMRFNSTGFNMPKIDKRNTCFCTRNGHIQSTTKRSLDQQTNWNELNLMTMAENSNNNNIEKETWKDFIHILFKARWLGKWLDSLPPSTCRASLIVCSSAEWATARVFYSPANPTEKQGNF